MSMFHNYDEKYQAKVEISWQCVGYNDRLEWARKEVLHKAFLSVAMKSLSEYGVNIKTVIHEYDDSLRQIRVVGAAVLLSLPKHHIMTQNKDAWAGLFAPMYNSDIPKEYTCIWCGSRQPKDDRFHSGTCENCGGPKI